VEAQREMAGFRLGSAAGVEIRIDVSWFVIFFLILWTLTLNVFPAEYPGAERATYIAMGLAATLLFFLSLLLHELAHALVARARGIEVEGITLFIFGGMARMRVESETPADEFLIAAAGPLASFALAAGFGALAWAGAQAGWPPAALGVARYLALINAVLAIFNLFPGFPLDGGRIFRAIVWKATGSLRRATRWAATGGRIFGLLLIAFGILNLFAGNVIGGMWMALIGFFLRMAAEAGYTQHVLRRALEGVRVADLMTPDPVTVAADLPLRDFVDELVLRGRHHSYPVVDDGRPLGIITLDHVRAIPREEWDRSTVTDAMLPADDDLLARPDESMLTLLERMGRGRSRVLVHRDGRLAGILTHSDVARWLQQARLLGTDD
jgi:Zn-dependent protease/CBS domain-containing protein